MSVDSCALDLRRHRTDPTTERKHPRRGLVDLEYKACRTDREGKTLLYCITTCICPFGLTKRCTTSDITPRELECLYFFAGTFSAGQGFGDDAWCCLTAGVATLLVGRGDSILRIGLDRRFDLQQRVKSSIRQYGVRSRGQHGVGASTVPPRDDSEPTSSPPKSGLAFPRRKLQVLGLSEASATQRTSAINCALARSLARSFVHPFIRQSLHPARFFTRTPSGELYPSPVVHSQPTHRNPIT